MLHDHMQATLVIIIISAYNMLEGRLLASVSQTLFGVPTRKRIYEVLISPDFIALLCFLAYETKYQQQH